MSGTFAGGGFLANLTGSDGPGIDVGRVVRRTIRICIALAAVSLIGSALLGHILVGVGVVLGMLFGLASNRIFQARSLHMLNQGGPIRKRPFASSVMLRLVVVTAIVLYLVYALPQLGWGAMAGICVFQFLLLLSAIGSLLAIARGRGTL